MEIDGVEELVARRISQAVRRRTMALMLSLGEPQDLLLMTLRFHLAAEGLLQELITLHLPRGARLLKKGRLAFRQKLLLVGAFDVIPAGTLASAVSQLALKANGGVGCSFTRHRLCC